MPSMIEEYFFNCSKEYVNNIDPALYTEITDVVSRLPKRSFQKEINVDLFWLLGSRGWSYDRIEPEVKEIPPRDLELEGIDKSAIASKNTRSLCLTSTTLSAHWYADFAKKYGTKLVQIEAQFGKVELMFKNFCGFRIAWHEKRLALGVEIVLCDPGKYFSHRKKSISGMAYFRVARDTLSSIGLDCPIWLIGIKDG